MIDAAKLMTVWFCKNKRHMLAETGNKLGLTVGFCRACQQETHAPVLYQKIDKNDIKGQDRGKVKGGMGFSFSDAISPRNIAKHS